MIELNNSAKHSGGVGRGAAVPPSLDRTEQERRRTPAPPNRGGGGWGGGGRSSANTEAGGFGRNAARQLAVRGPRAWNGNSGDLGLRGFRIRGIGCPGPEGPGIGIRDSGLRDFGIKGFGIRDSVGTRDWVPGSLNGPELGFGIRDSGFGIRDSGIRDWLSESQGLGMGIGIRDSGFGIRIGIRDWVPGSSAARS